MSKPVGRPPKPVEQKRRTGNPGKRPLPEVTIAIPTSPVAPVPHRPLGPAGQQFWERVWSVGFTWIVMLVTFGGGIVTGKQIGRASCRERV